jgi:hypothetical protein
MKGESLKNYRELFYYFLRRVRRMLAKHGKRMMMWNDSIDIGRPTRVPCDILQQFWRIAGKGRGPRRGCSLNKLVKSGFDVVNSFYPETYLDLYIREERLVKWHPQSNPPVSKRSRSRIIGGECCAWSDGGKDPYLRCLPSALAVFGDRVWNRAPITDADGLAAALPRHIFGPRVPDKMQELFQVLGAMVLDGRTLYALEPSLLTPIPREQRRNLCERLLRVIAAERRKKSVMNVAVLGEYSKALKGLHREL